MSVEVRHNGERWDVDIATSSASTPASLLEALQTRVAALSNIAPSFQKLLYKGKNLAKHPEPLLRCLDQQKALRVMLVGSSAEAVEASRAAATAAAAAVASRRGVRFEVVEAAAADASGTLFNALEPLPGFADGAIASAYLARLARDRGVKVVMERHGWRVGVLFELFPKGNVGLSPSCLMGINVNKGQRIGLRLRTDDLAGWRPYASVRKVLFHELTHMEHSEHGIPFNEYMAALLREADANDWTVSVGHRLDGGAVPKVRHGSESTRRRAVVMSDTGQVYTGGHGVAGGGGAASGGAGSGSRRAALARAAEARLATSAAAAAAAADKVVVAVAAAELVPAAAVAVAEAGAEQQQQQEEEKQQREKKKQLLREMLTMCPQQEMPTIHLHHHHHYNLNPSLLPLLLLLPIPPLPLPLLPRSSCKCARRSRSWRATCALRVAATPRSTPPRRARSKRPSPSLRTRFLSLLRRSSSACASRIALFTRDSAGTTAPPSYCGRVGSSVAATRMSSCFEETRRCSGSREKRCAARSRAGGQQSSP